MRLKITDSVRSQVLALYNEGKSGADIMAATGIKSESTLYKIINELGIKGSKGSGLKRYVITLPADLAPWCDSQGDGLSLAIEHLIRESNLPYSQIEGTSENDENSNIADSGASKGIEIFPGVYTTKEFAQDVKAGLEKCGIADPNLPMPSGLNSLYSQNEGTNEFGHTLKCIFKKGATPIAEWELFSAVKEQLVEKQCKLMHDMEPALQQTDSVEVWLDSEVLWVFDL